MLAGSSENWFTPSLLGGFPNPTARCYPQQKSGSGLVPSRAIGEDEPFLGKSALVAGPREKCAVRHLCLLPLQCLSDLDSLLRNVVNVGPDKGGVLPL